MPSEERAAMRTAQLALEKALEQLEKSIHSTDPATVKVRLRKRARTIAVNIDPKK